MRKLPWLQAERYRLRRDGALYESRYGDPWGCFLMPLRTGNLLCIVANGDYKAAELGPEFAWEHVSVSLVNRCPTWEEMSFVKNLFWRDDECVVQYHPAKSDYINHHPYVLHLWKPLLASLPTPPPEAVGPTK